MSLGSLFERTVFLLGAGASMDAGCLSSQQMLIDLRDGIRELPNKDARRQSFLGIFEFIVASLNYQFSLKTPDSFTHNSKINIEDFVLVLRQLIDREFILPGPLVGSWNDKVVGWEARNDQIFDDFLSFATELLIDKWTQFDEADASTLLQPFKALTESNENFVAEIFSLNYDLIWETIFNSDAETLVETGFSANRWNGEFEDQLSVAKLRLSKLHGSIDWYFDDSTEEVRLSRDTLAKPLVIFGSSYKMQSFDPFISLLSRFRQKLESASLYVIVGYSFQDRYINNILIQSLGSEITRTALVVDPDAWQTSQDLVRAVEEIQTSRSLNEMLNLKRINPEKVKIIRMTAREFYSEYLNNNGDRLAEVLKEVEEGSPQF